MRFGCGVGLLVILSACGPLDSTIADVAGDAGRTPEPSPVGYDPTDAAVSFDGGAGGPDSDSPDAPPSSPAIATTVHLTGAVQKGPFIVGSTTTVSNLDADANPTGSVFTTATRNNLGQFDLLFDAAELIAVESTGFYYNEVTCSLSVSPLTLRAIQGVGHGGDQTTYVNVVTHLTFERIKKLLVLGSTFESARTQAEQELRAGLGIVPASLNVGLDGVEMNILGGDSDGNAYLFAVSTVLAEAARLTSPAAPDAALQELLNQISLDLAEAGNVVPVRRARVAEAVTTVNTAEVEAAFAARLATLGSMAVVPNLDRIIDQDGDGLTNLIDNCPHAANPVQNDVDQDGLGDICDDDRDGDGIPNAFDLLPDDSNEWTDTDGVDDHVDNCLGLDNADQLDSDSDGLGDACDDDRDGDGASNGTDSLPDDSTEWSDTDGVGDQVDNCLGLDNADQLDSDNDGTGDACDGDRDGDDRTNASDALPDDPSEWTDPDGVHDDVDNCLGLDNPDQLDLDHDGSGDACDDDRDGDGVANASDSLPDAPQEWTDSDGISDFTDNCLSLNNSSQLDADSDGSGDACDGDRDGDGTGNESDSSPDSALDWTDTDGVDDELDNCLAVDNSDQIDSDVDGIGNACDGNAHIPEVIVTIDQADVFSGSEVGCSYTYADADGDPDISTVEWLLDGVHAAFGSIFTVPVGAQGKLLRCRVVPDDGENVGIPVSDDRVVGNTLPTIVSVTVTPAEFADDSEDLHCTAVGTDPDGDDLTYNYAWHKNGFLSSETGARVAAGATTPGEHWECAATVRDDESVGSTGTASTTIATFVPEQVLASPTMWNPSGSPYYIQGTVTIGFAATLSVSPGVSILGNGHRIDVYGHVDVEGSEAERVNIESLTIGPISSTPPASVTIRHAHLLGGSGFGNGIQNSSLVLEDSVVEDMPGRFIISYPAADCVLARNVFIRSAGVEILTSATQVAIVNNVFIESSAEYAAVYAGYAATPALIQVHQNSFLSTDRFAVRVDLTSLDATNNYWGGIADTEIPQVIRDAADGLSTQTVTYLPTLPAPHPDTPDPTPWLP